jgi:GH15 family glucan-1,4-alpha-glucosidase
VSSRPRIPIADYGCIGDTRTAALVAPDGSIDWMCVPHFDGDPLFGRLIGGESAGHFRIGPAGDIRPCTRRYRPRTATLETVWHTPTGRLTLTDGMIAELDRRLLPATLVVRRLTAEIGPVDVQLEFDPRLGERRRRPRVQRRAQGLVCSWGPVAVALGSHPAGVLPEPGERVALTVDPGSPLTLVLAVAEHEPLIHVDPRSAWELLEADERRWQRWADAVDDDVPHREMVIRSLLTLRLLTYSPSGAPVAAPTTSLPEEIGGVRNWDYRFAWPRDASIGIGAFLGVGLDREARMFHAWLLHASRLDRPALPPLLTLHGKHSRSERILPGWPGYADSAPVRVGNGAATQHQLDSYGWVLDGAWLLTQTGHRLNSETWRAMWGFADLVAREWRNPDAGIWELRGEDVQLVHSKVMAWLALDRALRIAESHRVSARRRTRWLRERDAIARDVRTNGLDPERGIYTRSYGSRDLDAALLVLPLIGLEPPDSPEIVATIDAIACELSAGGPLLYRYPPGDDGLPGREGAFLPCAFWLVQALAAAGRIDEAESRLTGLIELSSPFGLYAEELDPSSGEHLGNFPQALTHAALVQASLALRAARRRATSPPVAGGIT